MSDLISRQALREYALNQKEKCVTPNDIMRFPSAQPTYTDEEIQRMQDLESAEIEKAYQIGYEEGKKDAQPERDIPKRVLWIRNDDVYCHRCGQKLMFPHISFTDYIPGEKQEIIVRWDDEGKFAE